MVGLTFSVSPWGQIHGAWSGESSRLPEALPPGLERADSSAAVPALKGRSLNINSGHFETSLGSAVKSEIKKKLWTYLRGWLFGLGKWWKIKRMTVCQWAQSDEEERRNTNRHILGAEGRTDFFSKGSRDKYLALDAKRLPFFTSCRACGVWWLYCCSFWWKQLPAAATKHKPWAGRDQHATFDEVLYGLWSKWLLSLYMKLW